METGNARHPGEIAMPAPASGPLDRRRTCTLVLLESNAAVTLPAPSGVVVSSMRAVVLLRGADFIKESEHETKAIGAPRQSRDMTLFFTLFKIGMRVASLRYTRLFDQLDLFFRLFCVYFFLKKMYSISSG